MDEQPKNAIPYRIKTCILIDETEYEELIHELFGAEVEVHYGRDGWMWYDSSEDISDDDVMIALSERFGVKVTNIHFDQFHDVWVVYHI